MCVDPGGNGAILNAGGEGGPGRPGGDRSRLNAHKMLEDIEDGLGTISRLHYAQSPYHCIQ
jgi:hypothetical protein